MSYWSYAISTAAHLINKLPTPNLGNQSPWEALYKVSPDLKHLSSLVFPLLTPYNSHKLFPKTTLCVFLGYPLHTKGYYCLDPVTHQLYTSRHVLFNETIFPGLSHPKVCSPTLSASSSSIDSWLNTVLLQQSCNHHHVVSSHESSPISTGQCPITTVSVPASVTDLTSTHLSPTNTHTPTLNSISLPIGLIDVPSHLPTPTTMPTVTSEIPIPTTTMLDSLPSISLPHTTATSLPEPISTNISLPDPIPHPRQTRSKSGIFKPKLTYAALVDYIVTKRPSYTVASKHSKWCIAMDEEFQALQQQAT